MVSELWVGVELLGFVKLRSHDKAARHKGHTRIIADFGILVRDKQPNSYLLEAMQETKKERRRKQNWSHLPIVVIILIQKNMAVG